MKISLHWLKNYIDLDLTVEELAHEMTMLGLEIEAIERPGDEITGVYIGEILEINPHPDADKIVVCKTNVGGDEPVQICCGAKNMKVGDRVPTAIVGATLPGGFEIARRKMRGVESQGMMCAASELGLDGDSEGLLILDDTYEIGADAKPLLGLDDVIMEIEVTPNRGDWASMIGVARELAARFNKALHIPDVSFVESAPAIDEVTSVTVEDDARCPRYMGRLLRNVKVGPSPQWLSRYLVAAGQRPINNIVDITNFVLLETGHPLHAFDFDKLKESRVVVRTATKGESMETLDGEKRTLKKSMLVIADATTPQCIAGVMGGTLSETSDDTVTIFLESAVFDPISVRKTSRALKLISESSQRFQRGADPEMAAYALDRAAALMQELAGAEIAEGVIDHYPSPVEARVVTLNYSRTADLLGVEIPHEEQVKHLESLGFIVTTQDENSVTVSVPLRRNDVSMEADLIEEVGRLHGFNNIPVTIPHIAGTERIYAPVENRLRAFRRFLVGLGLYEAYSWTFSNETLVKNAGLDEAYLNMVKLENPLSEKQATMRSSLIPNLLASAAHNLNRGTAGLAIFELGPTYLADEEQETGASQQNKLAIVLSGPITTKHWSRNQHEQDIFDLKGYVEAIANYFDTEFKFEAEDYPTFQPGQSATIKKRKHTLGFFGKVRQSLLKNWELNQDVYILEMELDSLVTHATPTKGFEAIPGFPAANRDLAVVVEANAPVNELIDTISRSGGNLLKSVEVFDIYTGKPIESGKKSVAFNLIFQSEERTLTEKDTQKSFDKILKQLENKHTATLR